MYNWDIRKIGMNMIPTRTRPEKPVTKSPLVKYIKMGDKIVFHILKLSMTHYK